MSAVWERTRRRHPWLWRILVLLLATLNGWQWYEHAADHDPIIAVVDAVFTAICVVAFLYSLRGARRDKP